MKKLATLAAAAFLAAAPAFATENLISNGDFEESSSTAFGGINSISFTDWSWSGGMEVLSVETTDVVSGSQALHLNGSKLALSKASLINEVSLLDDEVGQKYELTIHYKVISGNAGDIYLNSEWIFVRPNSESHDADVLSQDLTIGEGWQEKKVTTTKPTDGSKLNVSVGVKKGVEVILDDFRLERVTEGTTTAITATEIDLNAADVEIYTIAGQRINQLQRGINIVKQGNKISKILVK